MELDLCLQMMLQDTRSGSQRGGGGEGSWKNLSSQWEEGERGLADPAPQTAGENSVASPGLDAFSPMDNMTFGTYFRCRQVLQTHRYTLCEYRYLTASCKCSFPIALQTAVLPQAAFNNQAESGVQSSPNLCFTLQNPCVAKKEICQKLNLYASFISICTNTRFCRSGIASCPAEQ